MYLSCPCGLEVTKYVASLQIWGKRCTVYTGAFTISPRGLLRGHGETRTHKPLRAPVSMILEVSNIIAPIFKNYGDSSTVYACALPIELQLPLVY